MEILFVMPPSHVTNPQRRVHRRQRRVLMRSGDFEILGQVHLLPGVELSPYALASLCCTLRRPPCYPAP